MRQLIDQLEDTIRFAYIKTEIVIFHFVTYIYDSKFF